MNFNILKIKVKKKKKKFFFYFSLFIKWILVTPSEIAKELLST